MALFIILESMTQISAQNAVKKAVPGGEKIKISGIITSRGADSFTKSTVYNASMYTVGLTADTSVRTKAKGIFEAKRVGKGVIYYSVCRLSPV